MYSTGSFWNISKSFHASSLAELHFFFSRELKCESKPLESRKAPYWVRATALSVIILQMFMMLFDQSDSLNGNTLKIPRSLTTIASRSSHLQLSSFFFLQQYSDWFFFCFGLLLPEAGIDQSLLHGLQSVMMMMMMMINRHKTTLSEEIPSSHVYHLCCLLLQANFNKFKQILNIKQDK